jgi:zinc protease
VSGPTVKRIEVDGATLLLIRESSFPVVRFTVALRRGGLFDPKGKLGATRAMMEILVRGTTKRTREEWSEAVEELGSNIATSPGNESGFFRGVSLKRNFVATMELLAEALAKPRFDADEHEALIEELVQSLAADRDDDDAVCDIFLRRALHKGHPLERSPNGEAPQIQTLTLDDLRAVHAERLTKHDLVIAFAGDLDEKEALDAARIILRDLPQGEPRPPVNTALPSIIRKSGLHVVIADKPDRAQVQLRVAQHGIDGLHPDNLALWVGITAFGGTFTSPFTQEVRDVRGWSYVAHADFTRRQAMPASIILRSVPPKENALDCLALELDLLKKLAQGDLDTKVLERAKSYLLGRTPFEVATASDMLNPVLRSELTGLPADDIFYTAERIEALSDDDIFTALKTHVTKDTRTVAMVGSGDMQHAVRERFPEARVEVVDFRTELEQ